MRKIIFHAHSPYTTKAVDFMRKTRLLKQYQGVTEDCILHVILIIVDDEDTHRRGVLGAASQLKIDKYRYVDRLQPHVSPKADGMLN